MWLNYLVWVHYHGGTITHDFPHFELNYVSQLHPRYQSYIKFLPHVTDSTLGTVRLGSNRAWYNFYLNINIKKGIAAPEFLYTGAMESIKLWQQGISFNLEWTLLWHNPEQFVADLGTLIGVDIQYQAHIQQAIEQYRSSCYLPDINPKFRRAAGPAFRQNDLFKYWFQATIDYATDVNLPLKQREEQALAITQELYCTGR
jgi:hypothetical protein